jgi:Zn-dependent metalloprotease
VLQRRGIDDNRMEFISVVNCTYPSAESPPQWRNACWWRNSMWYGQVFEDGELRSMARHLDIAAHEVTHGVTETTANLVYAGESGALNESLSDIFGVIINNWYDPDRPVQDRTGAKRDDVCDWCWAIGKGLRRDGGPLRDLGQPALSGAPEHMDGYWRTADDCGGVHTNSNIHNKAAHLLLTARGADGRPVLPPREVALLYYLALLRLHSLAGFADMLRGLIASATTYYAGDPAVRDAKVGCIEEAYRRVGVAVPGSPGPAESPAPIHNTGGEP